MSKFFCCTCSQKFPFELLGFIFFCIVFLVPQLQKSLSIHQCCIIFLGQSSLSPIHDVFHSISDVLMKHFYSSVDNQKCV